MTTPAQPGSPTDGPHQPDQGLHVQQKSPAAASLPMKVPKTVLAGMWIALALVACQVWTVVGMVIVGRQAIADPSNFPGLTAANAKSAVEVVWVVVLVVSAILAVPLLWGAVQARRGRGRMLSFAAWLYLVISLPALFPANHHFPVENVLTMIAAAAIIVCQRQASSRAYYASHHR